MFGNDNFTTLLLHCDGANNSTTFTDVSAGSTAAHTCTPGGNCKVSTSTSEFGGASASFDATASTTLDCTGNLGDFTFASDFTVDWWMNTSTTSKDAGGFRGLATGNTTNDTTTFNIIIDDGSVSIAGVLLFLNNGSFVITGNTNACNGSWNHVAVTRSGTSVKLWVNGAQSGSTWTSSATFSSPSQFRWGGQLPTVGRMSGNLDELRISKGIARWNASFTVPKEPYDVPAIGRGFGAGFDCPDQFRLDARMVPFRT